MIYWASRVPYAFQLRRRRAASRWVLNMTAWPRMLCAHKIAVSLDSANLLLNHDAIVEGYSAAGTRDQQFVASRRWADLVREYLARSSTSNRPAEIPSFA